MMLIKRLFTFIVLFTAVWGWLGGAIPSKERAALIAIYNAADGDNWTKNSGWKGNNNSADGFSEPGSENSWHGITVENNHVTAVKLNYNNLTGPLPVQLGDFIYLTELNLGANDVYDLPGEIGNLTRLQTLSLGSNERLTTIPAEIGNLTQLQYLSIGYCSLSTLPPQTGNLTNLETLHLYGNNISSIPTEIGNLTKLKKLSLGKNPITILPSTIGNLVNLEYLSVTYAVNLETFPPGIGNLRNLKTIYAYGGSLTSLPPEIGSLSSLERLDLMGNKLETLPPEIGNLNNLKALDVSQNNLTGLPPEMGNMERIERLYLGYNNITSVPPEMGNLRTLWGIELQHNQLTAIPPEWKNLGNLDNIKLNNNLLASFPNAVAGMKSLVYLNLGNNSIDGTIPGWLGNLSNLEELNLGSNKLTGPVPGTLLNLKKLECGLFGRPWEFNRLYSNDERIRDFLEYYGIYWKYTQTIAPKNVTASHVFGNSVKVSWEPIEFIWKTGGYMVYYATNENGPWTYAGMTVDKETGFFYVNRLTAGRAYYFKVVTKTNAHNENANTLVSGPGKVVSAFVSGNSPSLIGSIDTPVNGSTVSGSVPVSGWAVSNAGMERVEIYLEQEDGLLYIDKAVFVEGARPDIQQLFPEYPGSNTAGWGYMLLTHFLPGGGNGTYKITAVGVANDGYSQSLGSKTFTCDNAGAVKPFGAIDTPKQGGIASGSAFVNFGWALTPPPNTIPKDGSTIQVWVDGTYVGNVDYNHYREDIAGLFPGYDNSSGAAGYFYLDTTGYENGTHTIAWSVEDDAGNKDGIGSRFFTIQNNGRQSINMTNTKQERTLHSAELLAVPSDRISRVLINKGYDDYREPMEKTPGENGVVTIHIKETERLRVCLFPAKNNGKTKSQRIKSIWPLPTGSTLDIVRGVFSWQPGPGFIGDYRFGFVQCLENGDMKRLMMTVTIGPKHGGTAGEFPGKKDKRYLETELKKD